MIVADMFEFLSINRRNWALFSVLLCCLLFTSCSGSGEKKVYVIARDPAWSSLRLLGKDKNLLGFSDELLFEISKREKIGVQVVTASSNALFTQLNDDKYDAILSSVSLTSKQREYYDASNIYYRAGPVLLVPEATEVASLEEMEGKVIGIELGSSVVFEIEQYPDLLIAPYENLLFALENLANGQVDGVIMGIIPASVYVNSFYSGQIKIASPPLTAEGVRLITLLTPEGTELVEHFNAGLKAVKEEGLYDELLNKWGLVNPDAFNKK